LIRRIQFKTAQFFTEYLVVSIFQGIYSLGRLSCFINEAKQSILFLVLSTMQTKVRLETIMQNFY
jgi:hypothetical protein